jgi:hypothetical protein
MISTLRSKHPGDAKQNSKRSLTTQISDKRRRKRRVSAAGQRGFYRASLFFDR